MTKTTATILLLALTSTAVAFYKFSDGSTPQSRCQKRLDTFSELVTGNREVGALYLSFLGAMSQSYPKMPIDQFTKALGRALAEQCMKEESAKEEA